MNLAANEYLLLYCYRQGSLSSEPGEASFRTDGVLGQTTVYLKF